MFWSARFSVTVPPSIAGLVRMLARVNWSVWRLMSSNVARTADVIASILIDVCTAPIARASSSARARVAAPEYSLAM